MKTKVINSFVGIWALTIFTCLSFIGLWHHSDFSIKKSFSFVGESKENKWQIIHFLGGECQCSEYITEYLVKRGPSKEFNEKVVIFDDLKNFYSPLKDAGFDVEAHEYEKVDMDNKPDGIPLLVIANPGGKVEYEGGYDNRMLNPFSKIKDLEIAKKYKNGSDKVSRFPAYGCYMSSKYKKWMDPFQMKYSYKNNN